MRVNLHVSITTHELRSIRLHNQAALLGISQISTQIRNWLDVVRMAFWVAANINKSAESELTLGLVSRTLRV